MNAVALIDLPWRNPATVAAALADEPFALAMLGGGEGAGWSYVAARPQAVLTQQPEGGDPFDALSAFIGSPARMRADGPPFQGGVIGLAVYELGAVAEGLDLSRAPGWPDLVCGRYLSLLACDGEHRRLVAVGRGVDDVQARARADEAAAWLNLPSPTVHRGALAPGMQAASGHEHEAAVADVVARIAAGEIFQANIARPWRGRLAPGARPYDLFDRLAVSSPAPFAAYFNLGDRILVSNSPERFLALDRDGMVLSEPIKGTRPRGGNVEDDLALGRELVSSAKDRAENLMIVDLMRNDLSRVCRPGEVRVPELFALKRYANVHHLVSSVTGRLRTGCGAADLLRATFPPGSITGAPKVQAMTVIARHEPPRGPFYGSMFWIGADGAMQASVLIRTAAFIRDADGWAIEARAGGGVVADSVPVAERLETEAKISAILAALEAEA